MWYKSTPYQWHWSLSVCTTPMYLVIIGKRKVAGHKCIYFGPYFTNSCSYSKPTGFCLYVSNRYIAHYVSSSRTLLIVWCTFQSIKRTKSGGHRCLAEQCWRTPNIRSWRLNFRTGYRTRDLWPGAATPNHLSYMHHTKNLVAEAFL